jgi:hypothetical protein
MLLSRPIRTRSCGVSVSSWRAQPRDVDSNTLGGLRRSRRSGAPSPRSIPGRGSTESRRWRSRRLRIRAWRFSSIVVSGFAAIAATFAAVPPRWRPSRQRSAHVRSASDSRVARRPATWSCSLPGSALVALAGSAVGGSGPARRESPGHQLGNGVKGHASPECVRARHGLMSVPKSPAIRPPTACPWHPGVASKRARRAGRSSVSGRTPAGVPALRRGVLDSGVQLGAEQNGQAGQASPRGRPDGLGLSARQRLQPVTAVV